MSNLNLSAPKFVYAEIVGTAKFMSTKIII